jgi:HAD superfamily hydrolase (TIGR01484 family)
MSSNMHPIKLIALDLDGTLALPNHQVSPATREGLHQLQDDGVEVVIATGRRYRSALYVIDNLGLETY